MDFKNLILLKDCGAGIGRITKFLLIPLFQEVDLLEQNSVFVAKCKDYVQSSNLKNLYCKGMQDFEFEKDRTYDLIWVQWVTGHLTDQHFIEFFKKCQQALTTTGIIVMKENNCKQGFIFDRTDSSITR